MLEAQSQQFRIMLSDLTPAANLTKDEVNAKVSRAAKIDDDMVDVLFGSGCLRKF